MSSTTIVTIDARQATRGYVQSDPKSVSTPVNSVQVNPAQAMRVAAKLGLSPEFILNLHSKLAYKPGVWQVVDSLRVNATVVNRLPSPPGTSVVQLSPIRYTTARLPYAGAPSEYLHMVRIMFSTYLSPKRTATLSHLPDGSWVASLRGFDHHEGIALSGLRNSSQSHAVVLVFNASGLLMSDACSVCWTDSTTSPATWAALASLSTLVDRAHQSKAASWVAVHPDESTAFTNATLTTPTPTSAIPQPVPAKTLDQPTALQWFAGLPLTEAYEFLQNASAVYTQRVNQSQA